MNSLFAIFEQSTQTVCTGTRLRQFSANLALAALFSSAENARKAMVSMKISMKKQQNLWMVVEHKHTSYYSADVAASLKQYPHLKENEIEQRAMDLKVVEIKLSIA